MNFKQFGAFILAFGLVVTFIGGSIAMDSPPEPQLTEPEGWRRDMERIYMSNPGAAAERRQKGVNIIIPGIIVAFVGLAIMLSSKGASPHQPEHSTAPGGQLVSSTSTPGGPRWSLAINGQTLGPYTDDALRAMISSGHVAPTTSAWCPGAVGWAPIHTYPGFDGT